MPPESLQLRYSDPQGIYEPAVTVSLGSNVRFGQLALALSAELGEAAISSVEIEDPGGILNVVGLRALEFRETAAPSNNQIVKRGVLQDRVYRRDKDRALITGADRLIVADLADYNWHLGARRFTDSDANRPAETPGARLRWLINNAAHMPVEDYGHVTYPSSPTLEANDYRSQTPLDLLADCAVEGQYNFWCDYNEAHGRPELFFIDPGSDEYASSLFVSNDLDDVDGITVFAPYVDAELRRSPSRIAYGALVAYPKGWVYRNRSSTAAQFGYVDQVAPMPNVKSSARAARLAEKFLDKNDEESDRLAFTVKVPRASVNAIRHGHLLTVKFVHLPGYEDWTAVRVLKRGVFQDDEGGEDYYRIYVEAVPAEGATASSPGYIGTVFAGIIRYDSALTPDGFAYTQDAAPPGWHVQAVTGPIAIDQGSSPYTSITTSAEMVVRIHAIVKLGGVEAAGDYTLAVKVNGATVGSDTQTNPGGYWATTFEVDLRNYTLAAGDTVSVTATPAANWNTYGTNSTFLRVGRGSFDWDTGGVDWEGP